MVGIEETQRISRRSVVAEESSKVSLTLSYIYVYCILLRDAIPIDHEASEYLNTRIKRAHLKYFQKINT